MPESGRTLGELIDMAIRQTGPMSIQHYMSLALTHASRGYYGAGDPLGARGDFITAPEISQMFGELIGFFFVNLWQQLGEPQSFTLLELGPGRGTLLDDALRVAARAEGFLEAMHLQLFEASEALRALQAERLDRYNPRWTAEISDVPQDPLFVIANEFFDALPIRQFVRAPDGWHERQIGLRDGRRAFGLSPVAIPDEAMPEPVRGAAIGEVYEQSLPAVYAVTELSGRIAAHGGALLAIDYGYPETRTGETLQAVSRHAYADPLGDPGKVDLSAHVDFGALAEAARGAGLIVPPLTTQGDFLRALGIEERARTLSRANPNEAANIQRAARRLTAPDEMGDLFKVFCAHSRGLEPAGLA